MTILSINDMIIEDFPGNPYMLATLPKLHAVVKFHYLIHDDGSAVVSVVAASLRQAPNGPWETKRLAEEALAGCIHTIDSLLTIKA